MSEVMTVARPYAKAIFKLALSQSTIKEWTNALNTLAMIVSDKNMQPVLTNPLLSKEELVNFITGIVGSALTDQGRHLIQILTEKKRLKILPAIEKLYSEYVAERERTIDVKVVSAFPIDKTRLQRMQHALQNRLKRQVTLQCSIDKDLLGGATIYAGGDVYDGSLRSKLKKLSERLCS